MEAVDLVGKKIVREELGYLKEDWGPLKNCFVATVTTSPFAIFGVIIFGPAFLIASVFALSKIISKFRW